MNLGALIYLWDYIKITYDAMSGKLQILQRTGTGVFGSSSSPLSISFNFVPLWIAVEWDGNTRGVYTNYTPSGNYSYYCLISTLTTAFKSGKPFYSGIDSTSGFNYVKGKRSNDSKTIYWYGIEYEDIYFNITLETIFNVSGTNYIFSAYA